MNHSFLAAISRSTAERENNDSLMNLDHEFSSGENFEIQDEKGSFNQINCSSQETECIIMESKLASTLILALAILIGFAFVGSADAKPFEFSATDFQPVTVACCEGNFKPTSFSDSKFQRWNHRDAFSFTKGDFAKEVNFTFSKNFSQSSDVAFNSFPSAESKVNFATGFQSGGHFAINSAEPASFDDKTFRFGDFLEFAEFSRAILEKKDFGGKFDGPAFDKDLAGSGCCRPPGFATNRFQEFDAQFQTQV